jgi:1-aminocyclopropane-1-carboxylate deaminase
MIFPDIKKSILQQIHTADWDKRGLTVFVKRDDLIHSEISGNKWRKLLYNIEESKHHKVDAILTFGGAYSNHLVATASACKLYGLHAVGIVRGDELTINSNETLKRCSEYGMQLEFVSRELYNLRNDYEWKKELHLDFPNAMIIPEGGANYLGVVGCQEIWKELPSDINRLFVAQGTTTTSAGILLGAPENCKIHAVPVLKGFDSIAEMKKVLADFYLDEETEESIFQKLVIEFGYDFGGYGKYTVELLHYIQQIYSQHQLPLDPIYTGKAFFAMEKTIQQLDLKNETIVFVHTGGIQGSAGIEKKEQIKLYH